MTYEYLCTACGHVWEAEQSISAAPLTTCPTCSQETAKRQVSGGAGFILKGGGWYADLYGSPKSGGSKKEDSGSSSSSSSSSTSTSTTPSTTTTDSKPKAESSSSSASGSSTAASAS